MVVLSRGITNIGQLDQHLIIGHELQHVLQHTLNKKSYLFSCILRDYGNNGIGIIEDSIPSEIDADKQAMASISNIFGPAGVNSLIGALRSDPDINKQFYAHHLERLFVDEPYDFAKETLKLWDSLDMENAMSRLKDSPERRDRGIYKTYKFAIDTKAS